MKRLLTGIIVIVIVISYLTYKYGKLQKSILDNTTLEEKKETVIGLPTLSDTEKALKALNELSNSKSGFSEVPAGLRFEKVSIDEKTGTVTIYAEYNGEKGGLGSFQESRMLLEIFKTVQYNVKNVSKFRIVFKGGVSPFYELKSDGVYIIDGENLILVEDDYEK
ncbi:MAG: hypothetical protein K6348_01640 [Deferribacterales bacterium]